jgi:hypothetical protein
MWGSALASVLLAAALGLTAALSNDLGLGRLFMVPLALSFG